MLQVRDFCFGRCFCFRLPSYYNVLQKAVQTKHIPTGSFFYSNYEPESKEQDAVLLNNLQAVLYLNTAPQRGCEGDSKLGAKRRKIQV